MLTSTLDHLRHHFIGYIALFFALGLGSAWAATELARNSVESRHIVEGQVKRSDIADDAISHRKIERGTLLAEDFAPGQLPQEPANPPVGVPQEPGSVPAGLTNVIVRVGQPLTLGTTESGIVTANCADGELATGGGVKFLNSERDDLASASYPRTASGVAGESDTPTGWGGRVFNGSGETKDAAAYAICAQR